MRQEWDSQPAWDSGNLSRKNLIPFCMCACIPQNINGMAKKKPWPIIYGSPQHRKAFKISDDLGFFKFIDSTMICVNFR